MLIKHIEESHAGSTYFRQVICLDIINTLFVCDADPYFSAKFNTHISVCNIGIGPSFTCVFFAVSLLQSGTFSIGNFLSKVQRDLPGAWKAGLGFWPLVDFVSYSLVAPQYIPLFVNSCSFCWTIYLSTIANRAVAAKDS